MQLPLVYIPRLPVVLLDTAGDEPDRPFSTVTLFMGGRQIGAVGVPVGVALTVRVAEPVPALERERLEAPVVDGERDKEAVVVRMAEREPDPVALQVLLGDIVPEADAVEEEEPVSVLAGVADALSEPDGDVVSEPVHVLVAVSDTDIVLVIVADRLAVYDGLPVVVFDVDSVGLLDPVDVQLALILSVAVRVTVLVADALAVNEELPLIVLDAD